MYCPIFFVVFWLLNPFFNQGLQADRGLYTRFPNMPRVQSNKQTEIDLTPYEKKVYSQNGEDGVIHKIFEIIGTSTKDFVEFGVEGGEECNTRFLREKMGWKGLMMDGNSYNPFINLQNEFITAENINSLFQKYQVPYDFDLLSIDIDYNDFYVWNAIDENYKPRVVVVEYNASHLPNEDKIVLYNPSTMWDGTNYCGASILALFKLGRKKGYSLVYVENRGVNLFFIRDDIIADKELRFKNINDVEQLYKRANYGTGPRGGHVQDPYNRIYISADEVLLSEV